MSVKRPRWVESGKPPPTMAVAGPRRGRNRAGRRSRIDRLDAALAGESLAEVHHFTRPCESGEAFTFRGVWAGRARADVPQLHYMVMLGMCNGCLSGRRLARSHQTPAMKESQLPVRHGKAHSRVLAQPGQGFGN